MPGDTKFDRRLWKARALLGIVAAIAIAAIFLFKQFSGAK
jgi:hypothetical protein